MDGNDEEEKEGRNVYVKTRTLARYLSGLDVTTKVHWRRQHKTVQFQIA